jgi:hypothetical protein
LAILTPTDLALLAPELDIDPGSILATIQQAQMIIEGPDGANRPLEIQEFTETPVLNGRGFCKISRLPIIEGEDTLDEEGEVVTPNPTPVTVAIRGDRMIHSFGFTGIANDNQWITLDPDYYEVDYVLGEIRLLWGNYSTYSSWGSYGRRSNYSTRPFRRPTQERHPAEMRITYTTGFDFQASNLSHEAQQIKYATAGIAKLQQSPLISGLKQYNLNDFYSVTYGSDGAQMGATSQDRTLLQDLLMVVRKYRPREFAA